MSEILLVIYIISVGISLFVRSIILSNQDNARQIFKDVLEKNYSNIDKANKIVSGLLLFSALVPVLNTVFATIFVFNIIRRFWELFTSDNNG